MLLESGNRMSDVDLAQQPGNSESYLLSKNDFIHRFGKELKEPEIDLLCRAYVIGEALHRGQTRDEGTPYFNHPIRVARILFEEIQVRESTILCAALLHDVVEDSQITVADLCAMFNSEIADAVRLLTKTDGIQTSEYVRAIEEESPQVAVPIKLSDRVDNLRGLPLSKKPGKREKYLEETSTYFLPLAKRHNEYLYQQMSRLIDQIQVA